MYDCPFCDVKFPKYQQLGGHKSKSHPLMSKAYTRKQIIREQRTGAREVLLEAKKIYYSKFAILGSHVKNRDKLVQIQRQLKNQAAKV